MFQISTRNHRNVSRISTQNHRNVAEVLISVICLKLFMLLTFKVTSTIAYSVEILSAIFVDHKHLVAMHAHAPCKNYLAVLKPFMLIYQLH